MHDSRDQTVSVNCNQELLLLKQKNNHQKKHKNPQKNKKQQTTNKKQQTSMAGVPFGAAWHMERLAASAFSVSFALACPFNRHKAVRILFK